MLKLAIDAGLPLIAVQTDDTVNVGDVIAAIAEYSVEEYSPSLKPIPKVGHVYYIVPAGNFDFAQAYKRFVAGKAVLVVVNPPIEHSAVFDAGVVVPPASMIAAFVKEWGGAKNQVGLMAAMAGLSFEQVYQVSKLAMAKHSQLTSKAVRDIRRTFFGSVRGLQMLPTEFFHYQPAPVIQEWLHASGRFLTEFDVPRLTPRGLLFNGPPGVGKTMAAKYLARELGLPLYLLDVAGLMDKYLGETEGNLRIALKQAEQSAPCIMLIDEVEKLFGGGSDDSGVTARMLSSILFWLQEHKAKVLTVMTTNKEADIPPELYRPGRIDREIKFTNLKGYEIVDFAAPLATKLAEEVGIAGELHWDDIKWKDMMSHAEVTEVLKQRVLEVYLSQMEG